MTTEIKIKEEGTEETLDEFPICARVEKELAGFIIIDNKDKFEKSCIDFKREIEKEHRK